MNTYDILRTKPHDSRQLIRYTRFIEYCKAQNEDASEYVEKHHICPEALFPEFKSLPRNPWNRVDLTLRQHYIAHLLLWKALPCTPTKRAFWLMSRKGKKSRIYESIRVDFVESMRGEGNPLYGKERHVTDQFKNYWKGKTHNRAAHFGHTHSDESKAKTSRSMKGNSNAKGKHFYICPHCGKSSKSFVMKRHHFDNCKSKL